MQHRQQRHSSDGDGGSSKQRAAAAVPVRGNRGPVATIRQGSTAWHRFLVDRPRGLKTRARKPNTKRGMPSRPVLDRGRNHE